MIELEDQDLKKEEAEALAKKTAENDALMAVRTSNTHRL